MFDEPSTRFEPWRAIIQAALREPFPPPLVLRLLEEDTERTSAWLNRVTARCYQQGVADEQARQKLAAEARFRELAQENIWEYLGEVPVYHF